MKRLLILLGVSVTLCSNVCALEWLTDLPTAMARAQKEKKAVLLNFTGSDWCPWCKKLKSEVFDQFDFALYAAGNLVPVEVDFPSRKKLSIDQINANYALASKYGISGYPTVILLNSEGRVLGKSGYIEGGPAAFVARIEKFPGMPHKGRYLVADPSVNATANSPVITVRPGTPGAPSEPPTAPPPLYGELTLKGISGVGSRRLALINNETLTTGEIASVKIFGTNVDVTVKEIRDASVVIVVQGQTRELSLARGPNKH